MKSIAIPQSEKAMDECGVFGFYNNDGFDSIAVTLTDPSARAGRFKEKVRLIEKTIRHKINVL